jgi:lysophospholipase L1-like esterase
MKWGALILVLTLGALPASAQFGVIKKASGSAAVILPNTFAWYGDSIAAGACSATTPTAALQAALPGWAGSTNVGDGGPPAIGGYTAAQIRARYETYRDTSCNGERCGVYLVEGGVNSIVNGVSAAATLADMVAIVDNVRSIGRRAVWFGILPFRGSAQGSDARTTAALAYNALMATECAARPDVDCIFLYSAFEDPASPGYLRSRNHDSSPDYNCDGIHLLQDGTNAMVAAAQAAIQ